SMERLVADEPLVVDGVVVDERERDGHTHRNVDLRLVEMRVMDADPDMGRELCRARGRAGARRECGERQSAEGSNDHPLTARDLRKMTSAPSAARAMPIRAIWSLEG